MTTESGLQPEGEPRGTLSVRIPAMPPDTHANGEIFGGWVMAADAALARQEPGRAA
jgi:acyl-CoA thioesterase YciA